MSTRAVMVAVAIPLLFPLVQPTARGQGIPGDGLRLDNPVLFPDSTSTLLNVRAFPSSMSFDWMVPTEALPAPATSLSQTSSQAPRSTRSLSERLADWSPNVGYATGEIGFLYGRAAGRSSGDFKQTYIIGEVGDDKLHIVVGAAYEDSDFRWPRRGR